mmetsp:Transcript_10800/g.40377  ORF Transcript_10800/g.40377 Transcript_10800/m.40377 type:complete len:327 (-) Transcript_10800:2052-3032(-)
MSLTLPFHQHLALSLVLDILSPRSHHSLALFSILPMHKTHSIIAIALLSGGTLSAYIIVKILQNIKQGDWSALKWYFFHWYRRIRARFHVFSVLMGFLGGVLVYRVAQRHGPKVFGALTGGASSAYPYRVGKKYLITQNVHLIRSKQKIQQELERVIKENKDLAVVRPQLNKRIKKRDQSVQTQNALRRAYERVLEKVKIPGMPLAFEEGGAESDAQGSHASLPHSHHANHQFHTHNQRMTASRDDHPQPLHNRHHTYTSHANPHHTNTPDSTESTHRWISLGPPRHLLNQTTSNVRRYWGSSVGRVSSLFSGGAGSSSAPSLDDR